MNCDSEPCTPLAVLSERVDQITRRQDADITEIKEELAAISHALDGLTTQANRWKGGLGTLLFLVGIAGSLGGLVGWATGRGTV
ncbi:MAG: hypothetical protein K2Q10_12330 [Rhodospirillales bacterium]|nr:hypothetical protein [Rhodospirillales bacterium]